MEWGQWRMEGGGGGGGMGEWEEGVVSLVIIFVHCGTTKHLFSPP